MKKITLVLIVVAMMFFVVPSTFANTSAVANSESSAVSIANPNSNSSSSAIANPTINTGSNATANPTINTGSNATANPTFNNDPSSNSNLVIEDNRMVSDSFNTTSSRGFAIPGSVSHGPVLNYFGKGNPSSSMQDVRSFLIYNETFDENTLKKIVGFRGPRSEFKIVNYNVEPVKTDDNIRRITIIVLTDDKGRIEKYTNAQLVGYSVVEARNPKMTMLEVLAKGALDALQNGCNVYQIISQGSVNDVFSSGWGIGIHSTQAQVYSGGDGKSNVSSAGMGYSQGKAGMRDLPWLQGVGLVDNELK